MASVILHKEYNCLDDCLQSGCPGHKAQLSFNSIASQYEFNNGKGNITSFEDSELEIFIELLKELKLTRKEIYLQIQK